MMHGFGGFVAFRDLRVSIPLADGFADVSEKALAQVQRALSSPLRSWN